MVRQHWQQRLQNTLTSFNRSSPNQRKILDLFGANKFIPASANQYRKIEIGSYPFFRLGKIGVSIVLRSTEKKQIDVCYKKIISFLEKKKIKIIER